MYHEGFVLKIFVAVDEAKSANGRRSCDVDYRDGLILRHRVEVDMKGNFVVIGNILVC